MSSIISRAVGARHPTVPQNGVDARSRIHLGHVALDAHAHLSFAETNRRPKLNAHLRTQM